MATKKEDDIIQTPVKQHPDGPPPHEETLGALAGAPADIAEEYARTGKTPKGAWRDAQTDGVDLDALKGHGKHAKK